MRTGEKNTCETPLARAKNVEFVGDYNQMQTFTFSRTAGQYLAKHRRQNPMECGIFDKH